MPQDFWLDLAWKPYYGWERRKRGIWFLQKNSTWICVSVSACSGFGDDSLVAWAYDEMFMILLLLLILFEQNNCRCSELKLPNKFLLPWNKRNINVEIYSCCCYNANSFIWFHGWKRQNLGVTQIRCMGERNVNMEVTRLGHLQVLVILLSHKEKVGFYCCTADRTEWNNMKVT